MQSGPESASAITHIGTQNISHFAPHNLLARCRIAVVLFSFKNNKPQNFQAAQMQF